MRGKVRVMFPLQDRFLSLVAPRRSVSEFVKALNTIGPKDTLFD